MIRVLPLMRNVNTGRLVRKNGKLACSCCNVGNGSGDPVDPEYATSDCCCFLPPESGGCNGSNWDSCPPYGGVGKTPQKYVISVRREFTFNKWASDLYCANNHQVIKWEYTLNGLAIATKMGAGGECYWSGQIEGNVDWILEVYDSGISCSGSSPINSAQAHLQIKSFSYVTFAATDQFFLRRTGVACDSEGYYDPDTVNGDSKSGNTDWSLLSACAIKATGSRVTQSTSMQLPSCPLLVDEIRYRKLTASWRPLGDCDWSVWDATTDYAPDNCVAHAGLFWRCCKSNGPGTGAGVQEPTGTDTTCTGSNYWRLDE